MATYEEIYGKRVEVLDADPTLTSAYEGQVWYNSTSGTLKAVVASAVAVSSTNMPTATRAYMPIGASQDSFIVATGANPGTNYSTNCYEYNGLGWASAPSAGTARDQACRSGGVGTLTAGMISGGAAPGAQVDNTELYDGSSWTETGNLSDSRGDAELFGTQTAAALTGGYNSFSPPYWTNATEEFNGSSWTAGTATPLNTNGGCGVGTLTAGMIVGQNESPSNSYPGKASVTQTRNYDGTSWSLGGTLNVASAVNTTVGTQAAARKAGGNAPAPASYTNTEEWDNTAWTTGPSLATALSNGGGAGTSTAAVYAGGQTPPGNLNTTQEVTKSINTITAAAWASAPSLNTARRTLMGAGTTNSALAAGGYTGPPNTSRNESEEYDGSSWTAGNNLGTACYYGRGCGTQTAALINNGLNTAGGAHVNATQEYDGTNWTTGNTLPVPRGTYNGLSGVQTSAIIYLGNGPSSITDVQASAEYDGSSWTGGPSNATARERISAAGITKNTALAIAGDKPPSATNQTLVEEFNGTAWSESGDVATAMRVASASGPQTAALVYGGFTSTAIATTSGYDGTSWSTRPSLGSARYSAAPGIQTSSNTTALVFGGQVPSITATAEEFTGETQTVAASTLTTS